MAEDKDNGNCPELVHARRVIPRDGGYGPAVTIDSIIQQVAQEFEVTEEEILSRSTSAGLSFARDELCRRLRGLGFTYAKIGEKMGRTHSTIIAAVKRAMARIEGS